MLPGQTRRPFRKSLVQAYAAGLLLAALAAPTPLHAADAHQAVHAKPGEIVLLRTVPTRPAVRRAPPGMALIVDTKPNSQLDPALGSMELSDREAGAISAPVRGATGAVLATLAARPALAVPGGAQGQSTPRGAATDTTPLSVVGNATRGVGSSITGALQALPFGKPGGG
ncbi:MAG: hypothetical protein EPN38_02280 [Rhodanobacteraceae bacterium]|nr:MAG: hypothetical protein EPN38_02280 [Rhodanobacteraceae bacterium]